MHLCYIFHALQGPRRHTERGQGQRLRPDLAGCSQTRRAPENLTRPAQSMEERTSENENTEDVYLNVADLELRRAIIAEWEEAMSLVSLRGAVCAACSRNTPLEKTLFVKPGRIDFALLCNPGLPEALKPVTYNRAAYGGAILNAKGLKRCDTRGDVRLCMECKRALEAHEMPRYALANWLYYGHGRLPADVKKAFAEATHVERILVSRARASTISYKFSELKGHPLENSNSQTSQRCVKGNVAIHPQDATHLNDVLPPSNDMIKDTVCAVFVGDKKPTKDTIEKLRPVLVRKSRVKTMIDFLISKNKNYAVCDGFRGFSQRNLDELFGQNSVEVEQGVPCSMEIGHIPFNDAVAHAGDGYVPGEHSDARVQEGGDLLMENVGFTDSDNSPVNFHDMSMKALSHCLRGGQFISSQAGSRFIPDFENSELLSWLFPHLDPWGIGGFFHKGRPEGRTLSLDQQLKYLLTVDDSPFREDPDFAFVYYNIRQKKAVLDSITFQVSKSQREGIVGELLRVNVEKLDKLIEVFSRNPHYRPHDAEEISIIRLLSKVNAASHDLPGSNGYKINLRNEIRALVNHLGTPTLFVTLNPSDRDHPLVRLYAGHEVSAEDEMRGEELTRWQRTLLAARNPSACARFFHTMMMNFINIVLRFGRPGRGLFG
ncbi:hypothetical protein OH77DRAFT_1549184, partial [Trametes cingulata]